MFRSLIGKIACVSALALALSPLAAAQKQLAGEWAGTVNAPGGSARIVWHVIAAPDGAVTSTFDNQDEGILGIKVKTLELKDSAITITVDDVVQANGSPVTIRGTLSGTVNKDATELKGTWTQTDPEQPPMDLVLVRQPAPSAPPQAAQSATPQPQLAGDWKGVLMGQLHLVLHIGTAKDGTLSATMDSLDQNANGIPISSIVLKDGKLSMTVDAVHGTYDGTLSANGNEIDGTWSQGQPLELNFTRAAAEPAQPAPPAVLKQKP